jgi:DNA-binding transcriptional ArsR family regulator
MATRRAHRLPDPVEAALGALDRALRASAATGRDAQRVQAAVRTRVAALTAAPAGQLAAADLARALRVLDVTVSEAGRLFGVSRSAVEQWLERGVPAARLSRAANLARIADILERNVKPERIAAVVREPAAAYGGRSLLALVGDGRDEEARALLEQAFDWSRTA